MQGHTPTTPKHHVVPLFLLIMLALITTACLPPLEEQKTLVRKNDLQIRNLSSRAFIETWGPPSYEHRELTQFFVTDGGMYIPRFRVPVGEPPKGWSNEVVSGEGYFLGYPDRGELLGFVEEEAFIFELIGLKKERLVYRERLTSEQIHRVGQAWKKQEQFKVPFEGEQIPFKK